MHSQALIRTAAAPQGLHRTIEPRATLPPLALVVLVATMIGNISGCAGIPSANQPSLAHRVILSWTPSITPTVVGYNVYRGTEGNGTYPLILNSGLVEGTTFTDADVTAGQTYYYVVRAVDSDGTESANSNPASATIPDP